MGEEDVIKKEKCRKKLQKISSFKELYNFYLKNWKFVDLNQLKAKLQELRTNGPIRAGDIDFKKFKRINSNFNVKIAEAEFISALGGETVLALMEEMKDDLVGVEGIILNNVVNDEEISLEDRVAIIKKFQERQRQASKDFSEAKSQIRGTFKPVINSIRSGDNLNHSSEDFTEQDEFFKDKKKCEKKLQKISNFEELFDFYINNWDLIDINQLKNKLQELRKNGAIHIYENGLIERENYSCVDFKRFGRINFNPNVRIAEAEFVSVLDEDAIFNLLYNLDDFFWIEDIIINNVGRYEDISSDSKKRIKFLLQESKKRIMENTVDTRSGTYLSDYRENVSDKDQLSNYYISEFRNALMNLDMQTLLYIYNDEDSELYKYFSPEERASINFFLKRLNGIEVPENMLTQVKLKSLILEDSELYETYGINIYALIRDEESDAALRKIYKFIKENQNQRKQINQTQSKNTTAIVNEPIMENVQVQEPLQQEEAILATEKVKEEPEQENEPTLSEEESLEYLDAYFFELQSSEIKEILLGLRNKENLKSGYDIYSFGLNPEDKKEVEERIEELENEEKKKSDNEQETEPILSEEENLEYLETYFFELQSSEIRDILLGLRSKENLKFGYDMYSFGLSSEDKKEVEEKIKQLEIEEIKPKRKRFIWLQTKLQKLLQKDRE